MTPDAVGPRWRLPTARAAELGPRTTKDAIINAYQVAVEAVRSGASPTDQARDLYHQLTDDERLWLLDGDTPFWEGTQVMMAGGYNLEPYVHGSVERIGLPGLRFSDGPRGCMMGEASTAFPVSMARGATWDVALEERVGEAIGREVRAQGGNFFAGVCINLPRHPAWGRAQETYAEDPLLLGGFGAALTRGVRRYVMACAKHYAVNSMENARFTVDVQVDETTLHDVYLPHFKRVVDEGVDALMTAYNAVNGEWCGESRTLITDIARGLWGFEGITVSDFILGLRDPAGSLEAGLDVEEPFSQQRALHLRDDLEAGRTSWDAVAAAGVRILATQLRYDATHQVETPSIDVVACDEHRALAREVAARSMVLLRNETVEDQPVLPLEPARLKRLAVIGRLADLPNTGDHGSSNVRAPYVVTPLAGLRAALPDTQLVHVDVDDPDAAARAAADCDAAIVVVGYTYEDEGEYTDPAAMFAPEMVPLYPPKPDGTGAEEAVGRMAADNADAEGVGGDRASLTLRPVDEDIIRVVAGANARTVVAIVAAGAVLMERWRTTVPGILMAWYAGMEGGHALADVLLGRVDASGRLPFSIPTSEDHLPYFDRDAETITYDRWHGQRLLDRLGVEAAYPLGSGLSFGRFELREATAVRGHDGIDVQVEVANTGARDGRHVVQVYGRVGSPDAERHLLGFTPLALEAGGTALVDVRASLDPLARWDAAARQRIVPEGPVSLEVGGHAGDVSALTLTVD